MSRRVRPTKTESAREAAPLRADARRNRDRLTVVAQKLFEAKGLKVEMDEIARTAGVGVGTLYRHFATKELLIQEVLASHVEVLAEAARARAHAADAGTAFFEYLQVLANEFLAKERLYEVVALGGFATTHAPNERDAFHAALETLLKRAQASGAVRADITVSDVVILVRSSLFPVGGQAANPSTRRRLFDVVCNGLRRAG